MREWYINVCITCSSMHIHRKTIRHFKKNRLKKSYSNASNSAPLAPVSSQYYEFNFKKTKKNQSNLISDKYDVWCMINDQYAKLSKSNDFLCVIMIESWGFLPFLFALFDYIVTIAIPRTLFHSAIFPFLFISFSILCTLLIQCVGCSGRFLFRF